jgi:hypothetical protein
MDTFSVRDEFRGAKVFLTGASGYVGSVVLEQLLRCTDVDTVYCLLRPKCDQDPQQRLDKVLHSTLFHKVRETPAIKRARAVAGDIFMADLGLSQDDKAVIESEVNIILHCAADITLEADIQVGDGGQGHTAAACPGHALHSSACTARDAMGRCSCFTRLARRSAACPCVWLLALHLHAVLPPPPA